MAELKPYTQYRCSRPGCHSSHWTGAYTRPSETDDRCTACGSEMVEETSDGYRYRLEWESINPHQADEYERLRGKGVWPTLTEDVWGRLSWHPVARESDTRDGVQDQFATLARWADSHEQPIRNVRLSRSVATSWVPFDPAETSR